VRRRLPGSPMRAGSRPAPQLRSSAVGPHARPSCGAGRREGALAPRLEVVAERRLDARPDVGLVAGGGTYDLEHDGGGSIGGDPEQLPLGAEGDEVAGPGAAATRPEAELGPARLGPFETRRACLPPSIARARATGFLSNDLGLEPAVI
jgi:hypothetical protein